jgi:hypothetical protein
MTEFGCEYKKADAVYEDEQGNKHSVYYFERRVGEHVRTAAAEYPDDEHLTFSVIRSICARLQIDPGAFGLELG